MPFAYESPPTSNELRQGEILSGVWEHRLEVPPAKLPNAPAELPYRSQPHTLMIVLTQDCDLLQDWTSRSEPGDQAIDEVHSKRLPHVLLTDVVTFTELHPREEGSGKDRIRRNQIERFHTLPAAPNPPPLDQELFLDFKKVFGLPTGWLYEALRAAAVARIGRLPPYYLHQVIQRFFAFQSRVALPE